MFPIELEHLKGIERILSEYEIEEQTVIFKDDQLEICSVYIDQVDMHYSLEATKDIKNYMATMNYDISYEIENNKESFEFKIIIKYKG